MTIRSHTSLFELHLFRRAFFERVFIDEKLHVIPTLPAPTANLYRATDAAHLSSAFCETPM